MKLPAASTYLFRYPNAADPAVLLRVSDTGVVAFSQKCTHRPAERHQRQLVPPHRGDLDSLAWLPKVELAVALAAWTITFAGLAYHLGSSVSDKSR